MSKKVRTKRALALPRKSRKDFREGFWKYPIPGILLKGTHDKFFFELFISDESDYRFDVKVYH